jgi:2-oxoglutarate ferredoxin oxidoreductase subunit gamma
MRGGTSNVTVIISDEKISSPILGTFDNAIILNQQSLDKFEETIKPGGVLIYDPNGITRHPVRKDINIYQIAATDKASEIGISKLFNMIVLGGFLKVKPIINEEFIQKGLEKSLPKRHHGLIPDNLNAIHIGNEIIKTIQTV